ncbi:hypothetical protein ACJ41O_014354 [Fusarium nematophilum]
MHVAGHNVAASAAAESLAVLAGGAGAAKVLAKGFYKEMMKEELASRGLPTMREDANWGETRDDMSRLRVKEILALEPGMPEETVEMIVHLAAVIAGGFYETKKRYFAPWIAEWEKGLSAGQEPDQIAAWVLRDMNPRKEPGCHCGNLDRVQGRCSACGHMCEDHFAVWGGTRGNMDLSTPEGEMYWLLFAFAVEAYPDLLQRDIDGAIKQGTKKIRTCEEDGCSCYDFNLDFHSGVCACGHSYGHHEQTSDWYFVVRVAMMALRREME